MEALVRHGFLFWSVGQPYPETLREVAAFVIRHAKFAEAERKRYAAAYAEIDVALATARAG